MEVEVRKAGRWQWGRGRCGDSTLALQEGPGARRASDASEQTAAEPQGHTVDWKHVCGLMSLWVISVLLR